MMFRRRNSCMESSGSIPVYLNVYDIYSFNHCAYWLGLGVFHSGVQEYAYGAHQYPTTGIFVGEPRQCEGFSFRKRILVGWTELSAGQVREVMEELAQLYVGKEYHLITKNCNHFCNDFCTRLTGNQIPDWVNRLATIGLLLNCLIPATLCTAQYQRSKADSRAAKKDVEDNKKRAFTSTTTNSGTLKKLMFCSGSSLAASSSRRSPTVMPSSVGSPSPSTLKKLELLKGTTLPKAGQE